MTTTTHLLLRLLLLIGLILQNHLLLLLKLCSLQVLGMLLLLLLLHGATIRHLLRVVDHVLEHGHVLSRHSCHRVVDASVLYNLDMPIG